MVKHQITADTSYKKEQKIQGNATIFYILFGSPMANFGSLLRGQFP